MNPNTDNHPGAQLIDLTPNDPITDACGCNSRDGEHQRCDAAFCRATLAALARAA